jgi:hypothetical protein
MTVTPPGADSGRATFSADPAAVDAPGEAAHYRPRAAPDHRGDRRGHQKVVA